MVDAHPSILVLTPVKNAEAHLPVYVEKLLGLTYPAARMSLGLLEGDSDDDTCAALAALKPTLERRFRAVGLWKQDFGLKLPEGLPRWAHALQLPRRKVLARARNHLLSRALQDEDWVLWLDVDVIDYPSDLIERMLATGRDIVHPHCVMAPGGRTFDLNAWRKGRDGAAETHMDALRGGAPLVRLDSVGGTALFIRADIHRDGLVFPAFPYGAPHASVRHPHPLGEAVRGEIETEGLALMAADMGHQCWGMPNLEIVHA